MFWFLGQFVSDFFGALAEGLFEDIPAAWRWVRKRLKGGTP